MGKEQETFKPYLVFDIEEAVGNPGRIYKAADFDDLSKGSNENEDIIYLGVGSSGAIPNPLVGYTFQASSGSLTAPGFSWAVDTDTGFYWESDGVFSVSVNGTKRAMFDQDGLAIYVNGAVGDGILSNDGLSIIRTATADDYALVSFFNTSRVDANVQWTLGLLSNATHGTGDDLVLSRDGVSTRVAYFENATGYVRLPVRLRVGANSAPSNILDVTGSFGCTTTADVGTTLSVGTRSIFNTGSFPADTTICGHFAGNLWVTSSSTSVNAANGISVSRADTSSSCYLNWLTGSAPTLANHDWLFGMIASTTSRNLYLADVNISTSPLSYASAIVEYVDTTKKTRIGYDFEVFGSAALSRTNGQAFTMASLTELTTIAAAATTDTVIQIPVNAVVFAVSVRVTVAIPTAATFTVTGTTSATQFDVAGSVAVAINTTDVGTRNCPYKNGTAQTIRITPNLTPATNVGRVRVTIHYYQITAATS